MSPHSVRRAPGAGPLASCLLLVIVGGCALWQVEEDKPPALPPSKLSADSVVLEIAFVKLPVAGAASPAATDGDWWTYVDEQQLSAETRAALAKNGIRCGVLGEHLPDELRAMLPKATKSVEGELETDLEQVITDGAAGQRLPCRTGRRAEIQLGAAADRRVLLWHEGDQACGETLLNSQCLLALTTWPVGDGRVKLSITPEIKHGEVRNRYVGQEGRFLIESGQEQKAFNALRIECSLSPGETLALAATPEAKSLGGQFFAGEGGVERRLVLVRLALTQDDGLFAPERSAAPLVTPLE